MDSLDKKVVSLYKGKVVRKDLTTEMKKAVNVPSFVMEYLLGMYCSTDDEALIQVGIKKIKKYFRRIVLVLNKASLSNLKYTKTENTQSSTKSLCALTKKKVFISPNFPISE